MSPSLPLGASVPGTATGAKEEPGGLPASGVGTGALTPGGRGPEKVTSLGSRGLCPLLRAALSLQGHRSVQGSQNRSMAPNSKGSWWGSLEAKVLGRWQGGQGRALRPS